MDSIIEIFQKIELFNFKNHFKVIQFSDKLKNNFSYLGGFHVI
jgi:hypothetical protein